MHKLSIIVPCYNCRKTIERLLDSILHNDLPKDIYEVILCDDKSTDNFMELVEPYTSHMNITTCSTTREVHCPGNTRQAALSYITGDWFTFIDNDDMFESNGLASVIDLIDHNPDTCVFSTNFKGYDVEFDRYTSLFIKEDADTWLHGKFFNTEKVLNEFKCRFKDDLFSHEDVYFNCCVLSHLIMIGQDYYYADIFTYKWVYNPESLSRSYYNEKYLYIETYLQDYIVSASYPFFDMYQIAETEQQHDFAKNQILMALLHSYFYYQGAIWRLKQDQILLTMMCAIKSFKQKIIDELQLSTVDIINYIYSLPERYHSIKGKTFPHCNPFIETQSFRDFLIEL